jgi:hypothetical protein
MIHLNRFARLRGEGRVHALLLLATSACAARASAPPSEHAAKPVVGVPSSQATTSTSASEAPAALPVAPPRPLIVGSEDGLFRVSVEDGKAELISAGPALYPRYIDAETVVVVNPVDRNGLQRGAQLERVALSDGTRTRLAKLPAFRCKGSQAEDFSLDVQAPEGFQISKDGSRACLDLLDRNTNMASINVEVEIDLQSGKAKRALTIGEEECVAPADARKKKGTSDWLGCLEREPATTQSALATRAPFPFAFAHAPVVQDDPEPRGAKQSGEGARKIKLQGYGLENMSPSGRWLLLSGDEEDGDYLYRRLVLGDRTNGAFYVVPEDLDVEGKKPWPTPLANPVEATEAVKRPIESAGLVEGEADLRWLGEPGAELLVVGRLVLRPGDSLFRVAGEIAR